MRSSTLLVPLLLAGCAHWMGARPPPLSVSDDGLTATAGGERWTAPDAVVFYQRGNVLHAVSSDPARPWDVAVPLGPDGRLLWPADGPFEAKGGLLALRSPKTPAEFAQLVEAGQLHPHDDHFHLTHRFQNEDWQALYRDRAEDSPLSPIRRQVAATILARLLDERIPGGSPDATKEALRRLASIIGKVRRAVEGNVPAAAVEAIAENDMEIRDDGRTLEIEGRRFRAMEPLRFRHFGGHLHVEHAGGRWAQSVPLPARGDGPFAWPPSLFFEPRPDGTVAERPSTGRWRQLVDGGQIKFAREHWHVTESYAHPRLQFVLAAVANPKVPPSLQDRARSIALELLSLRLETGSEAEFEARLDAIDQAIERAGAELEKEIQRASPRR